MACAAELLLLHQDGFVLGHVGDSRVYRFRNNELVCLTVDHSFVQQQVDLGNLTIAEARSHPYRNVILRAVGTNEQLDIDIIRGRSKPGDLFLLCSDGLTDMVEERDIAAVLILDDPLENKVIALINRANDAGGMDNITVVLVAIGEK